MKVHTLKQKVSWTGSIHDIESASCARKIEFPKGANYAVVLSNEYGGNCYTTHKTVDGVVKTSNDLVNVGLYHEVIDSRGRVYFSNGSNLELCS